MRRFAKEAVESAIASAANEFEKTVTPKAGPGIERGIKARFPMGIPGVKVMDL